MDMQTSATPASPIDRTAAAAAALVGMLKVARSLAQAHRTVDLAGLDQHIGRLCAASLDLPPEDGRAMRPLLANVLAELDALARGLPAPPEDRT